MHSRIPPAAGAILLLCGALHSQQESVIHFRPGGPDQTAIITVPAGALRDDTIAVPFPPCWRKDCREHVEVTLPDGRRIHTQEAAAGVSIECHESPISNGKPEGRGAITGHLKGCHIGDVGGSLPPGRYQIHMGMISTEAEEIRVWFVDDLLVDAKSRRESGFTVAGPSRFAAHTSGEMELEPANTPELFDLALSAPGVSVTLRLPDGRTVTPESAKSMGIDWKTFATAPGSDDSGIGMGMFLLHKPVGCHHILMWRPGELPRGRYVFVLDGNSEAGEFIAVAEHAPLTEIGRILEGK